MRRALFALMLALSLPAPVLGCSSDCRECHTIPKDKDHEALSLCSDCHRWHSDKALNGRCGADCFDCHDYKETIDKSSFHLVLLKCIECHKKLEEKSQALNLQDFLTKGGRQ